MRHHVLGGSQFEQVHVERGHLRLDVVEQVRLLHVTALGANLDFLEELRHTKFL